MPFLLPTCRGIVVSQLSNLPEAARHITGGITLEYQVQVSNRSDFEIHEMYVTPIEKNRNHLNKAS